MPMRTLPWMAALALMPTVRRAPRAARTRRQPTAGGSRRQCPGRCSRGLGRRATTVPAGPTERERRSVARSGSAIAERRSLARSASAPAAPGTSGVWLGGADALPGDRIPGDLLAARGFDVRVDDADDVLALLNDLAPVEPDHPVAGVLDLLEVVRDKEDSARLLAEFVDPGVAFDPELGVTGRQRLVDQQDLVVLGCRDGEPEP